MKRILSTAILVFALLCGCSRNEEPSPAREKVRVRLSGSMNRPGTTRAEGMVNPADPVVDGKGLPRYQMQIGIITIEDAEDINEIDTPGRPYPSEWNNNTAYLDRGFFGGDIPYADFPHPVDDGNIEYTNRDGDALQQLFYDETGTFYYLVAFYPYNDIHEIDKVDEADNEAMILDENLGAAVIFAVDGSQDIMSTQMGKGNVESENGMISTLVFKHRLASLRCLFVAESALAKEMHGDIVSVELVGQPDKVGLNIGISAIDKDPLNPLDPIFDVEAANIGVDVSYIDYAAVRKEPDGTALTGNLGLPSTYSADDAVPFGYMLVLPAQKYTFRILTTGRGPHSPLYATYDFGADPDPLSAPRPGTIYNLTFTMRESATIELNAAPLDPAWWLDQRYD